MKKHTYLFIISILFSLVCSSFVGCKKSSQSRPDELVIYTYDSFSGEWGVGPELARRFEEKTGIKVTYADCDGSAQILTKAILEKDDPYADLLIGLDNYTIKNNSQTEILLEYLPKNAKEALSEGLIEELNPQGKNFLTPYDFGHFAFVFNTQSDLPAPTSLEDLTKDIYKDKIILMDSRTSTVGIGFDVWVDAIYKDKAQDFKKRLEKSILTVSPSWSVGYGMFTKGEAPLVISYNTSAAYHVEYDEGDQFQAIMFDQGHVRQVEGAAIVKKAKNLEGAKQFVDFLISEEAQSLIPLAQWMFPANKNVELPESYKKSAPLPNITLK